MWLDTFKEVGQMDSTLASVFLRDRIPLWRRGSRLSGALVERASSVLASRLPVRLKPGEKRRLVFLLPHATQSFARHIAVSLLLADFVHRQSFNVPSGEKGRLIPGDLLLITQHIRECASILREVAIRSGTETLPLTKYWPIEVLSQYSPPKDNKPRVFVANPGWAATLGGRRGFGTVVIDFSHPRTADHLDSLLKQPSIDAAPVQILIVPPCEQSRLDRFDEKGRDVCLTWAWDPAAVGALEMIIEPSRSSGQADGVKRFLWLSEDDEMDQALAALHEILVGAMRDGGGRISSPLLEAWSIYHRFRQLAVPLVYLEEARRRAYRTVTLKERIVAIQEMSPVASAALGPYLDAKWPRITKALSDIYELLIWRKEPAKFYTLARAVQEAIESESASSCNEPVRIVAPTAHERTLLAARLGELVDGWSEALEAGRVAISTVREEPRLVAEGSCCPSILLGFRPSDTRHLDVYPSVSMHVVVYPFEAEVDEIIQARIHSTIERFQGNEPRAMVLKALRLPIDDQRRPGIINDPKGDGSPRSKRPQISRRLETRTGQLTTRRFQADDAVEPLDVGRLAGMTWTDEIVLGASGENDEMSSTPRSPVEFVEIVDDTGERVRYPSGRLVNVYYPATEKKERVPADDLRPGMLIIVLVDDLYEDVFDRLLEAIREERDLKASMALDLWQCAKQAALSKHSGNRRHLFNALASAGLGVGYEAVVGWFNGGEDEVIAPLSEADFAILAGASGIYSDRAMMKMTLIYIRKERSIRRQCGKILSRLLAQIASGQHYEVAVRSAKAIGTPLEQVATAVSLREVVSVSHVGTLLSM